MHIDDFNIIVKDCTFERTTLTNYYEAGIKLYSSNTLYHFDEMINFENQPFLKLKKSREYALVSKVYCL